MIFRAAAIAFGMYSKIPMPRVEWNEKNMRYAFCFFPLVGTVSGIITYLAALGLKSLGFSPLLFGCIMTVLPLFVTGGIHFDGFLDTIDALGSCGSKEKRLEILKDSRSGAFAVTGGLIYFALSVGFWSEAGLKAAALTAVGFTLSRALSGFAAVTFPLAKNTGLAAAFGGAAAKKNVRAAMAFYFILSAAAMAYISPIGGIAAVSASLMCFLYYYISCLKNFGGITGDLAGWFLQLCELFVLIAAVLTEKAGCL